MPQDFQNTPGLKLGKGNQIHESTRFELPVRLYSYAMVRQGCSIGRYSYVNTHTTLEAGTRVGRYCSISRNVNIGVREHPLDRLSTSPVSYNAAFHFKDHEIPFRQVPFPRPATTVIGNDVWIGANAVIRRGVTVGDGAVIGAGAFVTRDVAPYEIVGGLPARVIRLRFDPAVVAELMALKWWDLEPAVLGTVPFDDIGAALVRLREIRAGQSADRPADPPESGSDMAETAPSRPAGIAALQALIDAVPADPRRAPDDGQTAFAGFLRDKLVDADAPAPLLDAVLDEAARLETRYDFTDPADVARLNTKLLHLIEMVTLRPDPDAPLEADLRRTVREVMRTKH